MSRAHVELAALAVLLAAAWFAIDRAGPGPSSRAARPGGPASVPARGPDAGLTIRTFALEAHARERRERAAGHRDPFSFRQPAPAAPRAHGPSRAPDPAAPRPAPPRPEMSLAGIAEDTVGGQTVRTAVISAAGRLVMAKVGDRVLSRFLVVRIAADAVQLSEGDGSEVFTLALR